MPKDITAEIVYDGVLLAEGHMDVRELAPALLAMGNVLQAANRELNGDRAELAVYVESDFKGGSFHIKLGMLLTIVQHMMSFWGPNAIATAKQIAEVVGLVSGADVSLLGLLKLLKGEPPESVTALGDGNLQLVVKGSDNKIIVNQNVYQLAQSQAVRESASKVVAPLKRPGIDVLETRDRGRVVEHIDKADVPSFEPPQLESVPVPLDTNPSRQAIVEVIKPSFKEGLQWRVSDGGHEFGASMKDRDFIQRVETGERSFAKGDKLKVELKSTPHMTGSKLSTDHEILKVLGEFNAPKSSLLPDPD